MPEPQGHPLHPFRPQEAHVGVAVALTFIGQQFLVGYRRQFLTSHFGRNQSLLENLAASGDQVPSSSGVSSIATVNRLRSLLGDRGFAA